MIKLHQQQLVVDGHPRIIIAGEVHYFRLPVERWDETLDLAIEAGCNTIATYIPWHMHEEIEGQIDWTGRTRSHLNLPLFLEKIKLRGLFVFLRPGPFIMAEMKNEGLPYWLMKKHPDIIPTTWNHETVSTYTVDYLSPHFLAETENYYRSLYPHIAPYLHQVGGPIIAIQLDNEIGMLSWVSNSPDLTPTVLTHFNAFLQNRYGSNVTDYYPCIHDADAFDRFVTSPVEPYALRLHEDLGLYMRIRFRQFADALKGMLERVGIKDIPYVINVHGTSDGRALLYPIGLSQLKEAFNDENYLAGSDLYLEDFHMGSFHDFYVVNGMQASLNTKGQPLATVEFNCGDGNFGDDLGARMDPASTDLKTRICVAQGHKVVNYYLLSGGFNDVMLVPPHDGNDRIAITGQRHGFAAPINPEGLPNTSFGRLSEVNHAVLGNESLLADMLPRHDRIAMGWMPDYFMTESAYPHSQTVKEVYKNLRAHRAGNWWNVLTKLLLLRTINPAILDLQQGSLDVTTTPILYVESARYMAANVQTKLVTYVQDGGRLVLGGEFPEFTLSGEPCRVLVDGLHIQPQTVEYDRHHLYLSVSPEGRFSHHAETRVYYAQPFHVASAEPLAHIHHTKDMCAAYWSIGKGAVLAWMTPLPGHVHLLDDLLRLLQFTPRLRHDYVPHGIVIIPTESSQNKMYHIINVDNLDKPLHVYEDGLPLFGGTAIQLPAKRGLILPHGVTIPVGRILYATLEIRSMAPDHIVWTAHPGDHTIAIETTRSIHFSHDAVVSVTNETTILSFHLNSDHRTVTIEFED